MIVDKNTNPERDLYYLGGMLLGLLQSESSEEVDYIDLYVLFNEKKEITINLYSLVLDWLFVLGAVSKGENGKIIKCF